MLLSAVSRRLLWRRSLIHCQQAAEKLTKAVLVALRLAYPRGRSGHDIGLAAAQIPSDHQLHAAAEALESLGIINQPLASIAKKEEILYVYGQESEPIVLERHSPVLHLIQQIRDETHRFAVTFHRLRRGKRQTKSALEGIPGVGEKTARKLLTEFGSVANVQRAGVERLSEVIPRARAEKVLEELGKVRENA